MFKHTAFFNTGCSVVARQLGYKSQHLLLKLKERAVVKVSMKSKQILVIFLHMSWDEVKLNLNLFID